MSELKEETTRGTQTCEACGGRVHEDDEFCPDCGVLYVENIHCSAHADTEAEGVCVICCLPFCAEDGKKEKGVFLCNVHSDYEIIEGMVRVHGENDEATALHIVNLLREHGLLALSFSKKASPLVFGGPDYTMFAASGEYLGNLINEFKVMVPCQQVLEAEALLKELAEAHQSEPSPEAE